MVLVWVVVDIIVGAVQLVPGVLGGGYCGLCVAVRGTGVGAGAGFKRDWDDRCKGEGGEEG